jgi:thioredoxin reductase (NADPH)
MDRATEILSKDETWIVRGDKEEYRSRTVVIATGSVYRRLGIKGEGRLTGKGVSYCATCDGAFFKDKKVGVVGGGDNALTEALFLTKFCRRVKIIHRRDQFRAVKILQERALKNDKIEVIWDSIVVEIAGKDKIDHVTLRNVRTKTASDIKLDGLFISIGMDPNSDFVKGLVDMDEWGQIKVGMTMKTSLPGIFAAGDVTNACPEQMATAVGTGVAAALAVDEYLSKE